MASGIYCLRNRVNGKVYVGSAVDIKRRRTEHFWELRKKQHNNDHLQKAYNKYGEDNFEFTVIEEVGIPQLISREQYWIDCYGSANSEKGYNINPVAGSSLGYRRTPESREKNRIFMLGNKYGQGRIESPETKEKHRITMTGKKPTPVQIERQRMVRTGKKHKRRWSHESREKKRIAMLGKRYALGWKNSPESNEKRRVSAIAAWQRKTIAISAGDSKLVQLTENLVGYEVV